MKQLFSGDLEITGVGLLQERDSATDLEEAEAVLGPLVLGWVIWGSVGEMATEVWKCIWPGSLIVRAGQMRGKRLMIVSHCLESSVV